MATQLSLNLQATPTDTSPATFRDPAFEQNKVDAIHRWVPWIAGFSAGFVADALRHYAPTDQHQSVTVLDPFAGVGTTLVEGLRQGFNVVGFEINPFAALASRVKSHAFMIDPSALMEAIHSLEAQALERTSSIDQAFLRGEDISQCDPEPKSHPPTHFRSRVPFFSPAVERKVLHCLDIIREIPASLIQDLLLLALGSILVQISNYSYEPSLGSRKAAGKEEILNADVVRMLINKLRVMYEDIIYYRTEIEQFDYQPQATIIQDSSLSLQNYLSPNSIDIIVTSPPYLNNYHYVRNTRPHLFWLNLIATTTELRSLEQANFGKYWQTVRDTKPISLAFSLPELEAIIEMIASQNRHKGVYGGQGWANYATAYFNDCYRLCHHFQYALKPSGIAVVVLGNSVIQGISLPTDRLFGMIGELCGLQLEDIYLIRGKRVGTSIINSSIRNGKTAKVALYETAVVLRKH